MKKDALINFIGFGLFVAIVDYFIFTSMFFLYPLQSLYDSLSPPIDGLTYIRLIEGLIIFIEIIFLIVFVRRASK